MKLKFTLAAVLCCWLGLTMQAQDKPKEVTLGWTQGGSLGLDLSGIGIINPRIGSGANRFGLGGIGGLFANQKKEKAFWENALMLQLSIQRLGKTKLTDASGFQKNLDLARLTSRAGWKLRSDKLFFAVEGMVQSLLLKTYASNYLEAQDSSDQVIARFLSPIELRLSPGLDYRPNVHYSIFYSPLSARLIYVADDSIAARNIHGNDRGKNSSFQLGSNLVVKYTNKYFKERVAANSAISLYSNYLKNPQNVDVLWTNNISISIGKGFSLDLLGELNYDDDVAVVRDRNDDGYYNLATDGSSKGPQITGAFLLKYSKIF